MTPFAFLFRLAAGVRTLLLVVVIATTGVAGAHANDFPTEPDAFIKAVAERAIEEILEPDTSTEERISKFETLLSDAFDLEAVGRFVVGRAWRSASPEEQERFLDLFRSFNVFNWGSRFDEYGGQALEVTNVLPDGDKGYFIETRIGNPDGNPFIVTWRTRTRDDGLRIVDISVEGIWMSQTWRSEYSSVLKEQGGLGGLNDVLEERVEDLRAKSGL
ncbi:MlaC/ttg2D family ABC transporter substrate-binding protein [Roseospira navarrensis]|nr:ABC transporter substrate-binding protein [Roseospira navarrensis]